MPMPATSSNDKATEAALDLIKALQNPEPAGPLLPLQEAQREAMQTLAELFYKQTNKPS